MGATICWKLELELRQHKSMVGIKQYDGLHRSDCQACSRPLQEDMRATDPRSCPAGSASSGLAGYAVTTVRYGNHASIRGFAVIDNKVPKGMVQPSSGCHHPFPSLSKAVQPLFRVTSSEAGEKPSSSSPSATCLHGECYMGFACAGYTPRQMPRLSVTARGSNTSCLSFSLSLPDLPSQGLDFRHILTGEELLAYVWSVHTTPAGCLDDMSESRGLLPCMKSDGRRKDPEYKAILSMLWILADGNGGTSQEFMILSDRLHKSQDTSYRRTDIRLVPPGTENMKGEKVRNVERVSRPEKGLGQTARPPISSVLPGPKNTHT
ncbi:hypothetical protein ASPFODRAFT_80916 [Aspergillus luchuensis CBS 106.47]|uniref:Uncharacterized protein n=1 Tax=Aspergillus luchuensis (strain CBS 106.47) TaxID=1137211 RepID=A0A1M3THZ9_ASPLC|nr:hypothetical protein ASPFODRAFT_80916 [Aspergillus luchuensis CBS 106.47]